eukprot:m.150417 g.150417  ORF g.150417 m.150417 type:complete len:239 (-) comp17379_c0_seq2:134-850(-)
MPEQSEQLTGEEDEKHVCQVRAKLYQFCKGETPAPTTAAAATGAFGEVAATIATAIAEASAAPSWQERGTGQLSLNDALKGESSRIVMRQDMSKRLVLNATIWPKLALERITDKSLCITATNHALVSHIDDPSATPLPQIFLIKTNAKDSVTLYKALEERVAKCKAATAVEDGTAGQAPVDGGETAVKAAAKEEEGTAAKTAGEGAASAQGKTGTDDIQTTAAAAGTDGNGQADEKKE